MRRAKDVARSIRTRLTRIRRPGCGPGAAVAPRTTGLTAQRHAQASGNSPTKMMGGRRDRPPAACRFERICRILIHAPMERRRPTDLEPHVAVRRRGERRRFAGERRLGFIRDGYGQPRRNADDQQRQDPARQMRASPHGADNAHSQRLFWRWTGGVLHQSANHGSRKSRVVAPGGIS